MTASPSSPTPTSSVRHKLKAPGAPKHVLTCSPSNGPILTLGGVGVIVFQFQLNFKPGPETEDHLRECRRYLRSDYRMAIEFRDRSWVAPANNLRTMTLLEDLGAAAIVIDELKHELYLEDPPLSVRLADSFRQAMTTKRVDDPAL